MKKIIIINLEPVSGCMVSTSILKGLKNKYKDISVTVIVNNDENCHRLFRYNPVVDKVYTIESFLSELPYDLMREEVDQVINLSYDNTLAKLFSGNAKKITGFKYTDKDDKIYDTLYKYNKSPKNVFQLYYNLSDLKWKGEGYDLFYHPKTKQRKNSVGLAIVNKNLNKYVHEHLSSDREKLTSLAFKTNIFKRIDEANRHSKIITDDYLFMNIACFLRKEIFFLKTIPYNYQLEFFGKGNIIEVPKIYTK